MRNNNEELPDYDKVKQLRIEVLLIVLIIIAVVVSVLFFVRYNEAQGLKEDIKEAKVEKKSVEKYNKKIDKKQSEQLKKVGLEDVKSDMNNFNKLFFEWETWGEFSSNMEELRKLYPRIEKGDTVNISGKNVGSGESPKSDYDTEYLTTTNPKEISEVVTQYKDLGNADSETLWFITGEKNDGETFNITKMNHYREVNHD